MRSIESRQTRAERSTPHSVRKERTMNTSTRRLSAAAFAVASLATLPAQAAEVPAFVYGGSNVSVQGASVGVRMLEISDTPAFAYPGETKVARIGSPVGSYAPTGADIAARALAFVA
jgi:hypothetical protein